MAPHHQILDAIEDRSTRVMSTFPESGSVEFRKRLGILDSEEREEDTIRYLGEIIYIWSVRRPQLPQIYARYSLGNRESHLGRFLGCIVRRGPIQSVPAARWMEVILIGSEKTKGFDIDDLGYCVDEATDLVKNFNYPSPLNPSF